MNQMSSSKYPNMKKPAYFQTLPDTIALSPGGARLQSNSAFPSLDPTKHFKSVYERAGFDVYKPPVPRPKQSESSIKSSKSRSTSQLTPRQVFSSGKRNISEQVMSTRHKKNIPSVSKSTDRIALNIDSKLANKGFSSHKKDQPSTASDYQPSSATSSSFDYKSAATTPRSEYISAQSLARTGPINNSDIPSIQNSNNNNTSTIQKAPSPPKHQVLFNQNSQPPTQASSPVEQRFIQPEQYNPITIKTTQPQHTEYDPTYINQNSSLEKNVDGFVQHSPTRGNFEDKTEFNPSIVVEDFSDVKSPIDYTFDKINGTYHSPKENPPAPYPEDLGDISTDSVKYTPQSFNNQSPVKENSLNVGAQNDKYASSDEESLKSAILSPKNDFDFEDDTHQHEPIAPIIGGNSILPSNIPQFTFNGPDNEPLAHGFQPIRNIDDSRFSTASSVYNDEYRQSAAPFSTTSLEYEAYVKQQREISQSKEKEIFRELDNLAVNPNEDSDSSSDESDLTHGKYSSAQAFEDLEGELDKLTMHADHSTDKFNDTSFHQNDQNGYSFPDSTNHYNETTPIIKKNGFVDPLNDYDLNDDNYHYPSSLQQPFSKSTEQAPFDFDNPDFSKPLQIEVHSLKQVSTEDLSLSNTPKSRQIRSTNNTPLIQENSVFPSSAKGDYSTSPDSEIFEDSVGEIVEESIPFRYPPGEGPCRKCGLEISEKPIYSKTGELSGQWHRKCFTCTLCEVKFNKNISCFVLDDEPYCEYHYHLTNNSLCKVCGNGIVGQCLENDAQERYHLDCLKCTRCHKLVDSDYLSVNGAVFCEPCAMEFAKTHNNNRIEKRRTRLSFI